MDIEAFVRWALHDMRAALAHLRYDYAASLHISLKAPRPTISDAQAELNCQLRDERDDADFERRREEDREALERQYLLLLKQQEGAPIDPEEFAAPPRPEIEEEEEEPDDEPEEDDDDEGNVAQKKKPRPSLTDFFFDNQHPLADNYRICGTVCPDTVCFPTRRRDLAIHLTVRERLPRRAVPRGGAKSTQ